jgi:hypothetical protein
MASYIPAFVIEKNNNVFINSATSIGAVEEIPTPDGGGFIDADYWAVPINHGIYGGFNFVPYNILNPAENVAPSIDSYACVRISKQGANGSSDWYMVLGTSVAYITASGGGAALALVWPNRSHTIPLLPICQTMNGVDANGKYIAVYALPSFDILPATVQTWFIYGNFNGFALPAATANGYATTGTLLTFLNTATTNSGTATAPVYAGGWGVVGTWTVSADSITLTATQTAGPGTDVLCAAIVAILPSA